MIARVDIVRVVRDACRERTRWHKSTLTVAAHYTAGCCASARSAHPRRTQAATIASRHRSAWAPHCQSACASWLTVLVKCSLSLSPRCVLRLVSAQVWREGPCEVQPLPALRVASRVRSMCGARGHVARRAELLRQLNHGGDDLRGDHRHHVMGGLIMNSTMHSVMASSPSRGGLTMNSTMLRIMPRSFSRR